jgi:hypothetical protein
MTFHVTLLVKCGVAPISSMMLFMPLEPTLYPMGIQQYATVDGSTTLGPKLNLNYSYKLVLLRNYVVPLVTLDALSLGPHYAAILHS